MCHELRNRQPADCNNGLPGAKQHMSKYQGVLLGANIQQFKESKVCKDLVCTIGRYCGSQWHFDDDDDVCLFYKKKQV